LVGERLEQIDRGLRLPAEHEAGGEQVCGLCILGSALVQLPEVGQRMRVVVLLEIGESKIQKQSRLMRAESKCPACTSRWRARTGLKRRGSLIEHLLIAGILPEGESDRE